MVNDTTIKTGYWRINKDGTRTWIEQSNQPPKPDVEEIEQEPEGPVSPLISSKELYELDVQQQEWMREYSTTGEVPVAPEEERFLPYYEQLVKQIETYEETPEAQIQKADRLALTPFETESGTYDITGARAAGVSEDILIRVFGESLPSPLTQQNRDYLVLFKEYQRTGGQLAWEKWFTAGAPIRPQFEYGQYGEALAIISDVYAKFPDYTLEDIPDMLAELQTKYNEDPQAFLDDLDLRTTPEKAQEILQLIGMTEEGILQSLDYIQQEERALGNIQAVFPEFERIDQFSEFISEDFEQFIEEIKLMGDTAEVKKLIEQMGWGAQYEQFFTMSPKNLIADLSFNAFAETPEYDRWRQSLVDGLLLVKEGSADHMAEFFYKNPEQLRRNLISEGRNDKTEAIVKVIYPDMPEYQMSDFFSIDALVVEKKAEQVAAEGAGLMGTFTAGVGDLVANTGGVFKWLGQDGIGEKIIKAGQFMQVQAAPVPFEPAEFTWEALFTGEFWSTYGLRTLPTLMTLAIPGIGAYGLAGSVAARIGLRAVGKAILTGIGGAILSRPIESALEAGGAYDQARMEGLSHEEASRVADKVFQGNLKLAGLDAIQLAAAFMPTPFGKAGASLMTRGLIKTLQVGGKLFITGLTEGGEEFYQEMLQKKAMGDERGFLEMWQDPDMKMVFSLGVGMGLGMGAGGEIILNIQYKLLKTLTPEQMELYQSSRTGFISEGDSTQVATQKALDAVVEANPALQGNIREIVAKSEKELVFKQLKAKDEAQRVAQKNLEKKVLPIEEAAEATQQLKALGWTDAMIQEAVEATQQLKALGWTDAMIQELDLDQQEIDSIIRTQQKPTLLTPTASSQDYLNYFQQQGIIDSQAYIIDLEEHGAPMFRVKQAQDMFKFMGDYGKISDPTVEVSQEEITEIAHNIVDRLGTLLDKHTEITTELNMQLDAIRDLLVSDQPHLRLQAIHDLAKHISFHSNLLPAMFDNPVTLSTDLLDQIEAAFNKMVTGGVHPPTVVTVETPTGETIPSTMTEAEDPPEGTATSRVLSRIQMKPAELGIKEKIKKGWHKFNIKMIDDLFPMKRITDQLRKGGVDLSILENPYLLARLLRGVTSKATTFIEKGTFGRDYWKIDEQGKTVPNFTGEGLETILREVQEPQKWQDFSTYLTARRAIELEEKFGVFIVPETDIGLYHIVKNQQQLEMFNEAVRKEIREGATPQEAVRKIYRTDIGKGITTGNQQLLDKLKDRMTQLGRSTEVNGTDLEQLVRLWFHEYKGDAGNANLQKLGRLAKGSKSYKKVLHAILKERYPTGYIRIYRGSGEAGELALEREFTNVTSSRQTAIEFQKKYSEWGEVNPDVENVLIKIEDVHAIASVTESELIVESSMIKDRIENPLAPPVVGELKTGINPDDARAAIDELNDLNPEFDSLAERIYKYQDSLLVYGQEMGLISEELVGKLREYGNYVPFYRVFNELQSKGFMGKKMANIANPIKRIKGSEREIINPLESIVKNTYVMISAADRNMVGIALANLVDQNPEIAEVFERVKTPMARVAQVKAKDIGLDIEGMTEQDEDQLVDIFRPSFFIRGDEVTVLINGQKQYYRVDPELRDALLNLDRETLSTIQTILSWPAKWLRAGATLSPDFMVRNPLRDQLTAFCYSNYGFFPGIDFIKGLASILRKDKEYDLYKMSGAEHSMMVSLDRQYLQKTFKQIVEGKGFTNYIKHPLELFQIISELGEKATRVGEFKKGLSRGAIPPEAGYSARVVTLDFAQGGTSAMWANRYIAFFNANIRGWGRMISSFKEHPVRTSVKVFTGITLMSMAFYLINRGDPRWKEIPQWQKDLFWIVFLKGPPDNWESMTAGERSKYINDINMWETGIYRIPKPFELGILFGSVPERFLEWLDVRDPDMFKDMMLNLVEAGSPGFIPTGLLPIIENMSNYSFFLDRAIVPASRQDMPPDMQYTRYTSEFAKWVGELINYSPAKIDSLINGYTAGLGRYAIDILDEILKGTGIVPDIPGPDKTLADIPVVKAFVVRSPYGSSGETVNDFYKTLEKYTEGERRLKEYLETGEIEKFETHKAAHPELLFFHDFENDVAYSATARYLRTVAREMTEIRKKQDEVYNSTTIDGKEKRRLIDEMDMLKTDVARKALDLFMGEVPDIMSFRIDAEIDKLGTVIDEVPVMSLEAPEINDMGELNRRFNTILEGVTTADLDKLENIDPIAYAYVKKEEIEDLIAPIVNKKIYNIDPDLKEGATFDEYVESWSQDLVKNKELDSLTRRQLELLTQYRALETTEARRKFREDHPELSVNPTEVWLKAHPEENAQLAIWGLKKIYTLEAWNAYKRLAIELDIPDAGLPEITERIEKKPETHFAYQDFVTENEHNSWESQLLLVVDHEESKAAGVKSYIELAGLELPINPRASLELKVDNRALYDALEDAREIDTPVEGLTLEETIEQAVEKVMLTTVKGEIQFRDIIRQVEAIEKGTSLTPVEEEVVQAHVDYGRIIDEHGASSAEAMLFRVDNSAYDEFRLNGDIWGAQALEGVDTYRIPIWRIDVQYKEQDEAYNAIDSEDMAAREAYLEADEDYRKARRTREAFDLLGPEGQRISAELIDTYVQYYELDDKGFRQERFLIENGGADPDNLEGFAKAMHEIKGIDIPLPEDVPAVQYDDIYDQYQETFDRLEGLNNNRSEHYVEDPEEREQAREALRFDAGGKYTEFGLAEIRRNAYGKFVPDQYIDNYVGYYQIISEGKGENYKINTGTDLWYEDDWFLIENKDFYNDVYLGILENERKDFTKVPTRKVFDLYLSYLQLPHLKAKDDFRDEHRDLDAWLVLKFDYTPIAEKRRRGELTTYERFIEEWAERGAAIEESLRGLRGE